MTELRGPGGGGGNTNWKTLAEVKNEHLGHGDKVWHHTLTNKNTFPDNCIYLIYLLLFI